MATCFNANNPIKIGTIVYRAFSPVYCGIVTDYKIKPDQKPYYQEVTVRWKDGTTTDTPVRDLNCYRSLYEDHRRKADNMAKVIEELTSMVTLDGCKSDDKTHTLETHPNQGNVTVYQGNTGDWVASRHGMVGKGRTKKAATQQLDAAIQANTTRT